MGDKLISNTKMSGPMGNRAIYEKIRALKVGEELTVNRSEWKTMTPPTAILHNPSYCGQFSVRRLDERAGWVIVRLKDAAGAANVGATPYGPIATRAVYARVRSLRVGEDLTLKASEWRSATSPVESIGKSERYRDYYVVRELNDGKGWVISRIR
jgi:hypothetical protein